MKLTKFGHCCLLIEENDLRILTDPGDYSTLQNEINNIDLILITHEHSDHLHLDSLKMVLKNNPSVKIFTNHGVGKILTENNISHDFIEHGEEKIIGQLKIEGFGDRHADIYPGIAVVQNTGYFIADKLFYPGDALFNPEKPIEILALPVTAPWLTIAETLDYALALKPRKCFPVHDGMLTSGRLHAAQRLPGVVLPKTQIEYLMLDINKSVEF